MGKLLQKRVITTGFIYQNVLQKSNITYYTFRIIHVHDATPPSQPFDQITPMGDSHALLFKTNMENDTTNRRESLWHYEVPTGAITSHESDLLPDRTITSQQYFITIPFDYTAQKCDVSLPASPFSTFHWRAFYIPLSVKLCWVVIDLVQEHYLSNHPNRMRITSQLGTA